MSQSGQGKFAGRRRYRRRPSLFGPVVLIGLGTAFLLNNLGLFSEQALNWFALLQLWPLWLIFLGVNVIVRQAPGALGSFLSALVGLLAVTVSGYVLLCSEDNALLSRLGASRGVEIRTETIEYRAGDISSANINIDFGSPGANLFALSDSPSLIEGTVTYSGDLIFETSQSGGKANIYLDSRNDNNDWLIFLNPANWTNLDESRRWEIGLAPDVETDLTLDIGSGTTDLDLRDLDLSSLTLDGGSGSMKISLPGSDYDLNYDAGSGSTRMTLPAVGRQTIDLQGGSGSVTLYLPPSMEARIEIDGGSGSFDISGDRFVQVRGDEPKEGVWETDNYDDAPDRINLIIDGGSGSIRIGEP